ncbi:hypothetical protein SAMN04488074_10951 [Lentzea albidocapillata subsp. violacea]|uniref:Uncharacterized protein n=1 Tax=Lentzea albidocapillata subsp. violacea TaxID=128104 RepID=A0A1G9HFS4_9PSEU|nr:hypothetical protein [Lentzea albidocapillata]SDL11757.1 hypothetical protein SAMN04488074_10951 [Lentzea albidocapillata subsp. violacea]
MTNDGVGLPVRLHDLLLSMAGRVDDAALSQAREFLAVGELDRSIELLVGTLVAGSIPVLPDERASITWILHEVRSDASLTDRLPVVEMLPFVRHRFTSETDPASDIAGDLTRAVSVLPDIRSVRCVWRSSPTGSTPGPLPQRVVLVDIGPQGFAPATAYRIDSVLRKAGVRAAVEVLTTGVQVSEYHAAAVTSSLAVPISGAPASMADHVSQQQQAWFDQPAEELPAPAPVAEPTPAPEQLEETGSRRTRSAPPAMEGSQPFPPKPVKRIPMASVEPEIETLPEPMPINRAEITTELKPDELAALQAALAEPAEPSSVDANLSERERALLQQLHEELAQREQTGSPATDSGRWQIDRSSSRQSAFGASNNGHQPQ